MNKVILMGRLTKTPELKTSPNGKPYTSFNIAVERRLAKEGQQKADFLPCTAWSNTAEFITKWFDKGSMILVEGSMQSYTYDDNGKNRTSYGVAIQHAMFTGEKRQQAGQAQQGGYYQSGMQGYNSPAPHPQQSYQQQTMDDYNNGFTDLGGSSEDDLPF